MLYSPVSSSSKCEPAIWASDFPRACNPPRLPTFEDDRLRRGCVLWSMLPKRSRVMSWLPITTIVFSISSIDLSNATSTSDPAFIPSENLGIVTNPSALTNDIITPAPLVSGVAINLLPTLPTFTLRNSSSPIGDRTLRLIDAFSIVLDCGIMPSK